MQFYFLVALLGLLEVASSPFSVELFFATGGSSSSVTPAEAVEAAALPRFRPVKRCQNIVQKGT